MMTMSLRRLMLVGLLTACNGSPVTIALPTRSPAPTVASPTAAAPPSIFVISADRKSASDGQVVLAVDNDQTVEWFRTHSQLCDASSIDSIPDRRVFCTDKAAFRDRTHFASIVSSPDGMKVGFTIGSDTLAPDAVAGIFLRATGNVRFLTNYYIGNQFISFSPTGANFVYQGDCFEGKCALHICDSVTLTEKVRFNDSTGNERTQNATFVRWSSDNEVEYKLGTELKRASF